MWNVTQYLHFTFSVVRNITACIDRWCIGISTENTYTYKLIPIYISPVITTFRPKSPKYHCGVENFVLPIFVRYGNLQNDRPKDRPNDRPNNTKNSTIKGYGIPSFQETHQYRYICSF